MYRYATITVLALALLAPVAMAEVSGHYAVPISNPASFPVYYCPVSQIYWHPYEPGFIELHSSGIVHSQIIVRRVPVQSHVIVLHRSPTIGFIPHTRIFIGPTIIRRPVIIPHRPRIRVAPRRRFRTHPRIRTRPRIHQRPRHFAPQRDLRHRPRIHQRPRRPAPHRGMRSQPRTRPRIHQRPTRRHRGGVRSGRSGSGRRSNSSSSGGGRRGSWRRR